MKEGAWPSFCAMVYPAGQQTGVNGECFSVMRDMYHSQIQNVHTPSTNQSQWTMEDHFQGKTSSQSTPISLVTFYTCNLEYMSIRDGEKRNGGVFTISYNMYRQSFILNSAVSNYLPKKQQQANFCTCTSQAHFLSLKQFIDKLHVLSILC